MKKIGIIGAGSWGIALASLLSKNGHTITVYSAIYDEITMLSEKHEQTEKLPGVILPDTVDYTNDLSVVCADKDLLIMAVPSPYVRETAAKMMNHVSMGQIIVDVAKGIEEKTCLTLSQIISQEIPQAKVAVLSGPSHAEEVGHGMPTIVVISAKEREIAEYIRDIFMNEVFRVYTSPDMMGVELGGSLKNVLALAAGVADGMGYGDNLKAAIITRGIVELTRLGTAAGGQAETFHGLTGIGDLIVTCSSKHSRNRKAGMLIGQGMTMKEAMTEVKMVVEGVYSAKAAMQLAKKYNIEVPIIEAVNEVLFNDKSAKEALTELMVRDPKPENITVKW